ncbi:serine hydrolase [Polyangium jinanense]|uniref:serine hydrolase n=1 Tax=Polyangium jinanense TaxID=2829994 RepID=UPI0023411416|nr:serine hydrolase [Polyangium jinanense]MDC3955524.1 serine hydrolase [Polyangium jinanense]
MVLRRCVWLVSVALAGCASAAPPVTCPEPEVQAASPPTPRVAAADPDGAPVNAETGAKTPEEALLRLLRAERTDKAWLAKSFADAVPASKLDAIVAQMRASLGALTGLEKTEGGFVAIFEKGRVPTKITIDASGRITSLWFSAPELTVAPPLDATLAQIRRLPGKTSVLVLTDGKTAAEHAADAPLAVGSAFKLAVLAALREQIDGKKLAWDRVVTLRPEDKSLPTGILQSFPDGAPLTVHTLAALMIAQSDNTATDALIHLLGRAAVERHAPGNTPLLTTRELFVLKTQQNAALLERFRAADPAGRRAMRDELRKTPLPSLEAYAHDGPRALDVEWVFTARDLCTLLEKTKDLPVARLNPGLASPKEWDVIAYKGGSEPGILNLSTWAERGGRRHCIVATWNHTEPLDEARFYELYRALLAGARAERQGR